MANTDRLSKTAEGTGLVLNAASKFQSVDFDDMSSLDTGLTIVSGVLDIASAVSAFLPPPYSAVTPTITGIFNMFLPGPPPQPTTTEVINKLTHEIQTGFLEQKTFITNQFKKQKEFIAEEFDKFTKEINEINDFNEALFSKEFLRETKTDALALLDQVKEQYDYILPQGNAVLTEAEALDLDQHVSAMASTFHAARAKHAFTDRCPDAFLKNNSTDEAVNTRKLCALLLETYFSIEKFRDITLSQLVVILEKSPLKNLVSGYLMIMEDRKTAMKTFVNEYLVTEEEQENTALFCLLFQPCEISYSEYCPWSSDIQREGIKDYLTFISPGTKDVWSNIYNLCNIETFGCSDNANCQVSIQHYVDGQYVDIDYPYNSKTVDIYYLDVDDQWVSYEWPNSSEPPWSISFIGDTEVTIQTQRENFCLTETYSNGGGPEQGAGYEVNPNFDENEKTCEDGFWSNICKSYGEKCFDFDSLFAESFTIKNVGIDNEHDLFTFELSSGYYLMVEFVKLETFVNGLPFVFR